VSVFEMYHGFLSTHHSLFDPEFTLSFICYPVPKAPVAFEFQEQHHEKRSSNWVQCRFMPSVKFAFRLSSKSLNK